jgi:N-acetylglucosaminyldiphosphoundecaprenol N-acetyl-beta-D-mannosaminyltransferase
MLAFCKYSEAKGYRHFFYGGSQGVAQDLADELKRRFPNLKIAGTHAPPFRKTGDMEVSSVIESINASGADIIWVGLGTPKQDLWIAQHRHLLKAPVLAAVGAAFDFHTGRSPQAPYWMQRSGLEWLFRLINEPRRLAFRYLVYNPIFILLVIMQLTGLRKYPNFLNTFKN